MITEIVRRRGVASAIKGARKAQGASILPSGQSCFREREILAWRTYCTTRIHQFPTKLHTADGTTMNKSLPTLLLRGAERKRLL